MDIDNKHALVVQPPRDQALARISKEPTKLPEDVASAIAEGATPLDARGIISRLSRADLNPAGQGLRRRQDGVAHGDEARSSCRGLTKRAHTSVWPEIS
jgi:hypothetical protein